jgi:hypothetical protein
MSGSVDSLLGIVEEVVGAALDQQPEAGYC